LIHGCDVLQGFQVLVSGTRQCPEHHLEIFSLVNIEVMLVEVVTITGNKNTLSIGACEDTKIGTVNI